MAAPPSTFKAKPAFMIADIPTPGQSEPEKSGTRAFSFGSFTSEDDGDIPAFLRSMKEVNASAAKPTGVKAKEKEQEAVPTPAASLTTSSVMSQAPPIVPAPTAKPVAHKLPSSLAHAPIRPPTPIVKKAALKNSLKGGVRLAPSPLQTPPSQRPMTPMDIEGTRTAPPPVTAASPAVPLNPLSPPRPMEVETRAASPPPPPAMFEKSFAAEKEEHEKFLANADRITKLLESLGSDLAGMQDKLRAVSVKQWTLNTSLLLLNDPKLRDQIADGDKKLEE